MSALRHVFFCCVLWLTAASQVGAQPFAPKPGEYLAERGWGWLIIKPGRDGRPAFDLEALGSNMHRCSLNGTIDKGRAVLEGEEKDKPCLVNFSARGQDIEVKSNGACRMYCGMRAGFEGIYHLPSPGCERAQMRRTRDEFKKLYDRKAYAEARARLEPLLDACAKTLWFLDEGWIRNDLAITLHRLGDQAGCRRVLAKYVEEAALSDAEVERSYPPSDGEAYLPIIKAARTNLGFCRDPANRGGGK